MQDLYVISAVGKDQPGLVHSVARVLGAMNINIVDMDARAVRGHFMMFLVVDLHTSRHTFAEMKDRLEHTREHFDLGLHIQPYKAGRRKADHGFSPSSMPHFAVNRHLPR